MRFGFKQNYLVTTSVTERVGKGSSTDSPTYRVVAKSVSQAAELAVNEELRFRREQGKPYHPVLLTNIKAGRLRWPWTKIGVGGA